MINLWYVKVKLGYNVLKDVPTRYKSQVLALLVADGLYNPDGTEVTEEVEVPEEPVETPETTPEEPVAPQE